VGTRQAGGRLRKKEMEKEAWAAHDDDSSSAKTDFN
jgi:hypothetical protein